MENLCRNDPTGETVRNKDSETRIYLRTWKPVVRMERSPVFAILQKNGNELLTKGVVRSLIDFFDEFLLSRMELNIAEKESRQQKHYFYLNELQNRARDLPANFQQRLSYDLLCSLASVLLDGTVFEIVRSLQEVQQLEERNLFNHRVKMVNDHKVQRHEMQKKHKEMLLECQAKPHTLSLVQAQILRERETMEKRCDEEVRKRDMKTILELDQKVMDQQSTLEKAGVPGFYVTINKTEMRLQMYLLEFIQRLAQLEAPN